MSSLLEGFGRWLSHTFPAISASTGVDLIAERGLFVQTGSRILSDGGGGGRSREGDVWEVTRDH